MVWDKLRPPTYKRRCPVIGPSRQRRQERRGAARQAEPPEDAAQAEEGQHQLAENAIGAGDNNEQTETPQPIENIVNVAIANMVSDEIVDDDTTVTEEELVVVFGEHFSEEKFNHKQYWVAMEEKLKPGVSYFDNDGSFWNEKEKKNTTGFFQTVRLRKEFYRHFLYDIRNWPVGTKIIEVRSKTKEKL